MPSCTQAINTKNTSLYDIVIIGAGLVGCAMARKFTLEGARVMVLEKASDILEGASKGNSAILHTGFDAPPDSIEQSCIADNYQQYLALAKKFNLPILKTSALVLAWTTEEQDLLEGILEKAHYNGVKNTEILSADVILKKEPALAKHLKAGIHVPHEYVIDPWTTPFMYLLQAIENGASIMRDCEVLDSQFEGDKWQINTSKGRILATTVINCAGLYGDIVDQRFIGSSAFNIRPRKGQFWVYDTPAYALLKSIILPVPNDITKGVVICRTAFGKVLVGPTAEEQISRDDASVQQEALEMLRAKGESMLPALANVPVNATYAGIRPATEFKDFCIKHYTDQHYISVGGIRSTGLSAALGIASRVFQRYADDGHSHTPLKDIHSPKVQQISDVSARDWQASGNEGIVCHCERVTAREIKTALTGVLPVASLNGLKRRTRVTMGRCQGFYCQAKANSLLNQQMEKRIKKETQND
ncbi:MAG: FAD-dependent oxidoreductase [Arenicellales bacterium]